MEPLNHLEVILNSNNHGSIYYSLLELYKLEPNNINILKLLIEESFILKSYKLSRKYLNKLNEILNNDNCYLDEKITEKEQSNNYYLNSVSSVIIEELYKCDIYSAIDECDNLYIETNNIDYIYISAIMLYENNMLKEAFNYFSKYIKSGKYYLRETYIYMFFISRKLQCNNSLIYISKAYKLFNLDIDINEFINIVLNYENNIDSNICINITKNIIGNKVLTMGG